MIVWATAVQAADTAQLIRQGKTNYEKGRVAEALKSFDAAGHDPEALYNRFRIYLVDLKDTVTARKIGETMAHDFPQWTPEPGEDMQDQRAQAVLAALMAAARQPAPSPVTRDTTSRSPAPMKAATAVSVQPKPPVTSAPNPSPPKEKAESTTAAAPKNPVKPKLPEEASKPPEKNPPEEKSKAEPKPAVEMKASAESNAAAETLKPPVPSVPLLPAIPPKESEPTVQVNLTADLKDFLKGVSELTGENILYDQNVGGQVVMSGPADLPLSQVLDLAQQVLAMRGFVLVKMDQGWKVMPSSTALRANVPMYDTQSRGMTQEFITQIIRVDPRISLNEIRNILSTYLSPNNNFQVLPRLNLILLTDTRENVEKILELIRRLEDMQGRMIHKYYTLKFVKSQDLKARLDAMLSSYLGKTDYFTLPIIEMNMLWVAALPEDIQRIDALIQEMDTDFSYDVQMTVIPLKYSSEDQVAKLVGDLLQVGTAKYAVDNFKIIPDVRRRSVILSTVSPKILALVTKLINEIDQPDVRRAENIHIYKVGNADALKIADKLTSLYKDQSAADRIGIVADEQSNSLIITANAQRYSELEDIIKKLDLSRAQVWLEVYVVEVSGELTKKIGIQWFAETNRNFRGGSYTGGAGIVTGTTPGEEGLTIGITKAGTVLPSAFNAFLDNKDFDVLSTPHILVKDNEQAKISVGDVVPILQNSQVTPTGSVTRSFSFENVGTNLAITPHVNRPRVTMDFSIAIQEVKSVAEIGAPTRTNRNLQTTIAVESGQTVVLGGLMGRRKTQGRSGVPVLSKIPVVGALFRKDVYENKNTNLLVFITPQVIDSAEDLERMSREKKVERMQQEDQDMMNETQTKFPLPAKLQSP